VEEATVEIVEDFFQMVVMATAERICLRPRIWRTSRAFGGNIVAGDIAAITGAVGAIDRLR